MILPDALIHIYQCNTNKKKIEKKFEDVDKKWPTEVV